MTDPAIIPLGAAFGTTASTVAIMLEGGFMIASAACAVAFAGFWRRTRDRLFAWFAIAFAGLALHRLLLTLSDPGDEHRTYLYVLRLVCFLVILVAIIDKNRARPTPAQDR